MAQQAEPTDTVEYEYNDPADNLFPGYDHAQLIIDYYKTEGTATEDRYRYEIIAIDSFLTLTFRSPESTNFHYVDYQKERLLSFKEKAELHQALDRAKLTQIRHGIPTATFTGFAQEVLIVRSKTLNIAGGLAWSTISDDTASPSDREQTSSIGGNYDVFFESIRSYFPDLNALIREATSHH